TFRNSSMVSSKWRRKRPGRLVPAANYASELQTGYQKCGARADRASSEKRITEERCDTKRRGAPSAAGNAGKRSGKGPACRLAKADLLTKTALHIRKTEPFDAHNWESEFVDASGTHAGRRIPAGDFGPGRAARAASAGSRQENRNPCA